MRHFKVVVPSENGGVEIHPMKEWLRQHSEHVPPGLHASSTSHQLENGLKRLGWSVQELSDEVRVIMPGTAGYDVRSVPVSRKPGARRGQKGFDEEMGEISEALNSLSAFVRRPYDLIDKGREMAQIYFLLYCAENVLRFFIERVAFDAYGEDYFAHLNVPPSTKKSIDRRKQNEERNKWLHVRDDSELFYLDFGQLAVLVQENWHLFERHFPSEEWITTKIEDMVKCRNLVAHNSYIDDHERDVVRVNFRSIVRQLGQHIHKGIA
jgi:HEPN superfamily Swt1-like protein